jgi:hypothetical protein
MRRSIAELVAPPIARRQIAPRRRRRQSETIRRAQRESLHPEADMERRHLQYQDASTSKGDCRAEANIQTNM